MRADDRAEPRVSPIPERARSDDLDRIDQEVRINELRDAARDAAGGERHAWENPAAPPEIHEQFWQNVLPYQQAEETCHFHQL